MSKRRGNSRKGWRERTRKRKLRDLKTKGKLNVNRRGLKGNGKRKKGLTGKNKYALIGRRSD